MFGLDIFQQFFPKATLYQSRLRVYPIATRCPELEYGDKILLPEDAIVYINGTEAQYPLMFKIIYEKNSTYCSVKEFSAERGLCYIPRWIMKKLGVLPGDVIEIRNINIRKASFVKFRFRDGSFNNLSNPRAILENKLKSFSVVARKDRIHIDHLGKEYIIDILDCKPDVVVDIVETDVEVDMEYADLTQSNSIIPQADIDVPETVESPGVHTSDSPISAASDGRPINKFYANKGYFDGCGHSLKKSKSSVLEANSQRASGFRRESTKSVETISSPSTPIADNKFVAKEKSDHFKGSGHKLC